MHFTFKEERAGKIRRAVFSHTTHHGKCLHEVEIKNGNGILFRVYFIVMRYELFFVSELALKESIDFSV